MPGQRHEIRMPDNTVARLFVNERGFIRKSYDAEFDLSNCSREYLNQALAELSRILAEKVKKRAVEIHFHFSDL